MQIEVLKSKIHRVTITEANLNYVGSITIDEELMEAANLIEGERVQIWNVTNGERLDTYVIRGRRGSGAICLNGAAARKAQVGDVLIIASYANALCEKYLNTKIEGAPTNIGLRPENWDDTEYIPEDDEE